MILYILVVLDQWQNLSIFVTNVLVLNFHAFLFAILVATHAFVATKKIFTVRVSSKKLFLRPESDLIFLLCLDRRTINDLLKSVIDPWHDSSSQCSTEGTRRTLRESVMEFYNLKRNRCMVLGTIKKNLNKL
jgi:hypothetical protein